MNEIKVIDIRQEILSDNNREAEKLRKRLNGSGVFMVNLMSSPGAGKTSLLIQTIRRLKDSLRIGVVEGDIDSVVDSQKVADEKAAVVQIQTGGICYLDASMIHLGVDRLDLQALDLVVVENIGNLVCPAEFDIGSNLKVMILSVPEGDDKPLKYPMMFSVCDVLVVNKSDYLPDPGFDLDTLERRVRQLNPDIKIFLISCRKETGLDEWCGWLQKQVHSINIAN